jgi:hypothetical protein
MAQDGKGLTDQARSIVYLPSTPVLGVELHLPLWAREGFAPCSR